MLPIIRLLSHATACMALATPALAHDPSAWGGLFRTRDDGLAWLSADAGLFVGAALAVAVSPTDAGHLLYGTDTRLLRSRNAGRSWAGEAPQLFNGPTLALAFSADGKAAWAATPAGVYACDGQFTWSRSQLPDAALPARSLAAGMQPERAYLLGARGLYASTDGGRRFERIGQADLPDAPGQALLMLATPAETLFLVMAGRVWTSVDQGRSWAPRDAGLPPGEVQALAADGQQRQRLWAASGRQLHVSDDLGASWRAWGGPISDAPLPIRGLAVGRDGAVIVLATPKGLLRSTDGGQRWVQVEGVLPVHLEAGPLLRDPHDVRTLYAGFSLVPYPELRRRAEQGSDLLSRLDPVSAAGAGAFLLLLLIGGAWAARWLARTYRQA